MIVITKIYQPIPQSKQMVESFEKQGYEVCVLDGKHKGNGELLRELYACFKRAVTGHETFCYSDGADTYCQKKFEAPKDKIIYSTEKACYPHPKLASKFPQAKKYGDWKYLNGGGYCGSLDLIIEFFEKYGLTKHHNDANGQLEQIEAYLKAKEDGFPIELDYKCKIFQTISHCTGEDFLVNDKGLVVNRKTKSTPSIIHANGRTEAPEFFPFKIW